MQNLLLAKLSVLSLAALLSSGCRNSESDAKASLEPATGAGVDPGAEKIQVSNAPSGNPKAKYDEEAFQLTIAGPGSGQVGESVEVVIHLQAQSGYKVNQEYPIKFTFDASESVNAEMPVLKKEQGKVVKNEAELRGKVKLGKAGPQVIGGKLSFSVCTEERCLIEKRDLALPITAS